MDNFQIQLPVEHSEEEGDQKYLYVWWSKCSQEGLLTENGKLQQHTLVQKP